MNEQIKRYKKSIDRTIQTDRTKTCPMMLRLFCREGGFHKIDDFWKKSSLPIDDELIVYTWRDATLKELSTLIQQVHITSLTIDTSFSFRLLYIDDECRISTRTLGVVYNNPERKSFRFYDYESRIPDELVTLYDAEFVPGDYIDVAIYDGRYMSTSSSYEKDNYRHYSHNGSRKRFHG